MSWHRVRGESGIRKYVGNGGKVTYYAYASRNRKRIQKRAGSSLDLARQVRGKLLNQLAEEELYPERRATERIRLADFAERYIEQYLRVKAAKSARAEIVRIRRIKELLGNLWVDEIGTAEIERLLARLHRDGRSNGTINRYRTRLNSMMKKAVAWNHRRDNPVTGIGRLKEEKMGDRYLHPHEFRALLKACDPDLRALVHIAAMTGARRNELLTLQWTDIDLDLGFVTVRAEISKTSEGRRIPLNEEAQEVLLGIGPKDSGRVFGFGQFPRKRWEAVRRSLGWDKTEIPRLRGWRFHDMRHHCASHLAMADVSLKKIAKILGHKSLSTTERYAHLSDETLVDAMDRIQVVFPTRSANNVQKAPRLESPSS